MAGERVAQAVWVQVFRQASGNGVLGQSLLNGAMTEAPAALADEQGRLLGAGKLAAHLEPGIQCLARTLAERDLARLAALAEYPHAACAEVAEVQRGKLGQAQATGLEQFEHCLVADRQRRSVVRRIEKSRQLVDIQGAWQVLGLAWCADQPDRIE